MGEPSLRKLAVGLACMFCVCVERFAYCRDRALVHLQSCASSVTSTGRSVRLFKCLLSCLLPVVTFSKSDSICMWLFCVYVLLVAWVLLANLRVARVNWIQWERLAPARRVEDIMPDGVRLATGCALRCTGHFCTGVYMF